MEDRKYVAQHAFRDKTFDSFQVPESWSTHERVLKCPFEKFRKKQYQQNHISVVSKLQKLHMT